MCQESLPYCSTVWVTTQPVILLRSKKKRGGGVKGRAFMEEKKKALLWVLMNLGIIRNIGYMLIPLYWMLYRRERQLRFKKIIIILPLDVSKPGQTVKFSEHEKALAIWIAGFKPFAWPLCGLRIYYTLYQIEHPGFIRMTYSPGPSAHYGALWCQSRLRQSLFTV